jgi:chemotaxis-related protein WspB
MLYLLLDAGSDTYAVATASLAGVVPCAALKSAPATPPAVAGILNFHGRPVPVVDCGLLLAGSPSRIRFSTRIILTHIGIGDPRRTLGLMAENVTDVRSFEESDFVEPGARADGFPCAGRVAEFGGRWIQRLHAESILPPEVWASIEARDA